MLSLHLSPKTARVSIAVFTLVAAAACNGDGVTAPPDFTLTPIVTFDDLKAALVEARNEQNGGLGRARGGAVAERGGLVVSVVFPGATNTAQWPGGRVIPAREANPANAFSLPHLALSTANLYSAAQPGGTLFGLQEANPTNEDAAYGGDAADYGSRKDYMIGKRIGGAKLLGGGVPVYEPRRELLRGVCGCVGASCAAHH